MAAMSGDWSEDSTGHRSVHQLVAKSADWLEGLLVHLWVCMLSTWKAAMAEDW